MLGHDPERPGPDFRERIGVVLQQSELWPNLTVRETHAIFAGYYRAPRDVDEVIALVGLAGEGERARQDAVGRPEAAARPRRSRSSAIPTSSSSTSRRRASIPQARRAAWEMIRSLRSLGKTVLLTTHYLDEAEQLADRVAVLRDGQIVRDRDARRADDAPTCRPRSATAQNGEEVLVRTDEPTRVLAELTSAARRARRGARGLAGAPAVARGGLPRAHRRGGRGSRGRVSAEAVRIGARRPARRLFVHQLRSEQLVFWRSREAAFFIFLFPLLLFVLLGSVYSGKFEGVPVAVGGPRRAHRLRVREHRLRRPRDPARPPARERDPQAAPLDAAAAGDVRRGAPHLDAGRVRAPDGRAVPARPRALRHALPPRPRLVRRRRS